MPESLFFKKKGTLVEVFSSKFREISKSTFFIKHLRMTLLLHVQLVERDCINHVALNVQNAGWIRKISAWKSHIWDKVFENGPSTPCGRQLLKKLKQYGLLQADHTLSSFLKAAFHNFYLVHSWILSPIYIGQFSSNNFENLRIRKWNDFRYLVHKSLMPVYFGDNKFINF